MAPPKRRSPQPGEGAGASGNNFTSNQQRPQHTRPARRRSRRLPGPGERAVARELARLDRHIQLIDGGRP